MIRQSKYLFIGGPWDGQWHAVGCSDGTYRVRERSIIGPGRAATYYLRTVEVPGAWVVPIVVFVADPLLPAPTGTPMPGWVQGQVPGCCPIGSWQWISDHPLSESMHALHDAIRERRYRP